MLTLSLPVAPPANNAFANRKFGKGYGRVKGKAYRKWLRQADAHYLVQKLGRAQQIIGPYKLTLTFPDMTRGDLDGREKLIIDWLVSRKLVQGDGPAFQREKHTKFSEDGGDMVWIKIESVRGHGQGGGDQPQARQA